MWKCSGIGSEHLPVPSHDQLHQHPSWQLFVHPQTSHGYSSRPPLLDQTRLSPSVLRAPAPSWQTAQFYYFFFFNFSPEILRPNPWEAWLVLLPMGLREKTWNKKQFPSWSVLQILHVPSSSHSWKLSLCSWKCWYLEFFYHESFLDLQRTKCYLIWPECHCSPALLQLWLPLSPGPSAFPAMDFEPPFLEIPISINQHSWVFLHRCNSLEPQQEEKLCQLWL